MDRLTEDELYRIGDYGVGIFGFRPVVSLPASKALFLSKFVQWLEVLGIILFLISAVLFFMDSITDQLAYTIGTSVIILRALVILIGRVVIARTVYNPKTTEEKPDLESSDGVLETFDEVTMTPSLDDGVLDIEFVNRSMYEVSLAVSITSKNEIIQVHEPERKFTIPTQHNYVKGGSTTEISHNNRYDLSVTSAASEQSEDEIIISVSGSRLNTDRGRKESIDEIEARFTVEISNKDDIISDEYEYEIISR